MSNHLILDHGVISLIIENILSRNMLFFGSRTLYTVPKKLCILNMYGLIFLGLQFEEVYPPLNETIEILLDEDISFLYKFWFYMMCFSPHNTLLKSVFEKRKKVKLSILAKFVTNRNRARQT